MDHKSIACISPNLFLFSFFFSEKSENCPKFSSTKIPLQKKIRRSTTNSLFTIRRKKWKKKTIQPNCFGLFDARQKNVDAIVTSGTIQLNENLSKPSSSSDPKKKTRTAAVVAVAAAAACEFNTYTISNEIQFVCDWYSHRCSCSVARWLRRRWRCLTYETQTHTHTYRPYYCGEGRFMPSIIQLLRCFVSFVRGQRCVYCFRTLQCWCI